MGPTDQLSTEECWTLLRSHVLGRVAFTESAMPTIVPLSYSLDGTRLLLHCGSERLADVLDRQVIAFEVDDTLTRRGEYRSVVVTGTAERLVGVERDRDRHSDRATVLVRVGRVHGRHAVLAA